MAALVTRSLTRFCERCAKEFRTDFMHAHMIELCNRCAHEQLAALDDEIAGLNETCDELRESVKDLEATVANLRIDLDAAKRRVVVAENDDTDDTAELTSMIEQSLHWGVLALLDGSENFAGQLVPTLEYRRLIEVVLTAVCARAFDIYGKEGVPHEQIRTLLTRELESVLVTRKEIEDGKSKRH